MSDEEKSPEERGREAADAVMAGAEHVVGESLRSLWWLARWGCIAYTIYFVLASVAAFVIFALADLRLPWWAWVGLALLVGYMVNRRKA